MPCDVVPSAKPRATVPDASVPHAQPAKQGAARERADHAGEHREQRRERRHAADLRGHAHGHGRGDRLGRERHQHVQRQAHGPAEAHGTRGCSTAAGQGGQQQAAPAPTQLDPALPQRPAQGDHRWPEQEVDELRPGKEGGVGRARGQQRTGQHHHRPQHRIGPGRMARACGKGLRQHVHRQCGRKAEQRCLREVDPELNEIGHRRPPARWSGS